MPGPKSHYGVRSKDREARELRQHMNIPASGGGGGVTDHGALTGLADDDHANYVHLTAARTILAQHSFSPSSANAPFLLGANAQGQLVTGLRADQLNKDVIAGTLLTGGGTLTGDVTLNVDEASIDHGNLAGLGDDDHSQYVHISISRTITAQHSFSPGVAQAPFLLSANAQGQLITGLRADQLNKDVIAGTLLTGGGTLTGDVTLNVDEASIDHGSIAGLGDDDHSQYVHISIDRTITAQHSFSPGAAQAPFLLSANAQGQLVTGLRADQLNKDVIAGTLLTGGGTLTGDVTLNVDEASIDHGNLAGLGDDDHSQYVHISIARTISARHTFNPGSALTPFILHTNAQGQTVTGFRADELNKDVIAGNGLVTGGTLTSDVTVTLGDPSTLNVSTSNAVTVSSHTHAITASSAPTDAQLLKSDADGYLQLARLGIGIAPSYPLHIDGDLYFEGPQSIATTTGDLSILPADDLIITPVSTYTKITGTLQFQGAGIISTTSGNLTLSPAGDLDLDPTGSLLFSTSLIPSATDTYDIGSSVKLWRTGYFSELQSLLFVENSIQVQGGWLMVAYNQGTAQEDIDGTETAIDFGIDETGTNGLAANDFVLFRGYGNVEYMQILSQSGGLGSTIWNVTRNVDASGANTWAQGSVFAVLGYSGDGRIELVASQNDSPRISLFTQGTSYSAQSEFFRFGNLRDSYSIGSVDTYGFGVGDYATQSYIQVTATEGIEFFDNSSVQVGQLKGEIWTIGQVDASHKHVQITANTVQFMEDTIVYASLSGATWTLGRTGAYHRVTITDTVLSFYNAGTLYGSLSGTTWILGLTTQEHVSITSTAIEMKANATTTLGKFEGSTITLGDTTEASIVIDVPSNGITMTDINGVQLVSLSDGEMALGDTTYDYLFLDPSGISFYGASNAIVASLYSDVWTLGVATTENIRITSTAVEFRDATVVYGSLTGTKWTLGVATSERIEISTTTVEMFTAAGVSIFKLDGSVLTLGDWNAANTEYMTVSSTGIEMYSNSILVLDIDTAAGVTIGRTTLDHITIKSTGIQLRDSTTVRADFQTDGDIFIGTNTGATATTFFRIFGVASGAYGIGDLVIGSYASGNGNIWWDESASKLNFRIGEVAAKLWINSAGSLVAGGGDVTLDASGLTYEAPAIFTYGGTSEIRWFDDPISNNQISAGIGASSNRGTVTTTSHRRWRAWINRANEEQLAAQITINDVYNGDCRIALTGPYLDYIYLDAGTAVYIKEGASLYVGSSTTNANQTIGLTINIGADDTNKEAISLKATDVVHGMTAMTETDTFAVLEKMHANAGGLDLLALVDATDNYGSALSLRGATNTQYIGKGTGSTGAIIIQAFKKNGTTVQAFAAGGNVLVVKGYVNAHLIVDESGMIWSRTNATTGDNRVGDFDEYEDMALLHGLRASVRPIGSQLRERFGKFIEYARPVLERAGIIVYNDGLGEDGVAYGNHMGLMMLTIDTVRQFYDKQMEVNENIYEELRRVYAKMHRYEGALLEMGASPKFLEG